MRPPLEGGSIILTGASSGIGLAMARLLAPIARSIALVARRTQRLVALRDELKASHPELDVIVQACDLSDLSEIDLMLEAVHDRLGPIDILINNAGVADIGLFDSSTWPKVASVLQVNVHSLTYLCHRLLPSMVAREKGGVLNISSGFGLTFMPGLAAYVGAKHFVTGFTDSLRLELRDVGVVVTQICPGPVETEFEKVAENPTDRTMPAFMRISPEKCARQALKGFRKDKAMVIPGFVPWIAITLGRMTPRWLLRLVFRGQGRFFRTQQAANGSTPAPTPAEGRVDGVSSVA